MRYVTKPIEIEAMKFDGKTFDDIRNWSKTHTTPNGHTHYNFDEASNWVMEGEGIVAVVWDYLHKTWVGVRAGDYIIKGMKGEFYPCDPEVFEAKYEPVNDIVGVITAEQINQSIGNSIQQSRRFQG